MLHMHITSWAVMLVLLVASLVLKNKKTAFILHNVMRAFYILVISTGAGMIKQYQAYTGEYMGKAILGILTIGFIEMTVVRKEKGKKVGPVAGAFVVFLALTIVLGLKLSGDLPF